MIFMKKTVDILDHFNSGPDFVNNSNDSATGLTVNWFSSLPRPGKKNKKKLQKPTKSAWDLTVLSLVSFI